MQVTDGRGTRISLPAPPRRIVSLVPSTTESLFAIGCGDAVVGITRFCVHPAERLAGITKVGGTKDLVWERLAALEPDLVIGNAEENSREMFAQIEAHYPLYVAFPRTVDEAIADLRTMGVLVGRSEAAEAHAQRIEAARAALRAKVSGRRRVAYLIWRKPCMAVSGDTFISAMLAEAGLINALADAEDRYPTITAADLADLDAVLLSSEPFPFAEKHRAEVAALAGLPVERVVLVDGELCSWHGVRMAEALAWMGEELLQKQ